MIAVLVSGGIDSLVAAYLLKNTHPSVLGIHLRMGYNDLTADDIRTLSDRAGIPVETVDCRASFKAEVVDCFVDAYLKGLTPNPCLRCNSLVKFKIGLDYALGRGAELLTSGHYCRIDHGQAGWQLVRGVDRHKDQSYFLALLAASRLCRIRFPLGDMTKPEVLALAAEKGLKPLVARESQDVCFIPPEETYADFIERQTALPSQPPGQIVDMQGRVIGEHAGVHLFTVGQRRGINCPGPRPYYVAAIDRRHNRIRIGFREDLLTSRCRVRAINWIGPVPGASFECAVKVRYQHRAAPARVDVLPDLQARITFAQPQFGIAPGQGAVFYRGETVLGGGIIIDGETE